MRFYMMYTIGCHEKSREKPYYNINTNITLLKICCMIYNIIVYLEFCAVTCNYKCVVISYLCGGLRILYSRDLPMLCVCVRILQRFIVSVQVSFVYSADEIIKRLVVKPLSDQRQP